MCGVDRPLFSRRAMLSGLSAGSLLVLAGCADNPQLGRQQLILVEESQLNEMGVAAWRDIRQHEQVSRRPQVNRRIQEIGSTTCASEAPCASGSPPWPPTPKSSSPESGSSPP